MLRNGPTGKSRCFVFELWDFCQGEEEQTGKSSPKSDRKAEEVRTIADVTNFGFPGEVKEAWTATFESQYWNKNDTVGLIPSLTFLGNREEESFSKSAVRNWCFST